MGSSANKEVHHIGGKTRPPYPREFREEAIRLLRAGRQPEELGVTGQTLRDGRGICAELIPELISLDDRGYPIVTATAVPSGMTGRVRGAADLCPVLALRMRRVRGREAG